MRTVLLAAALIGMVGVATAGAVKPISYATPSPASGTVQLTVDLTGAARGIYAVRSTMPVSAGPLTLAYPKWIPGDHAPSGPIRHIAGLTVDAGGHPLRWTRNPLDMYEFEVTVPRGVSVLDIKMIMVGMGNADRRLADMDWNSVLLYPLGKSVSKDRYQATLVLPDHWHYATALNTVSRHGDTVTFAPTSLYRLVDSPVMAGAYYLKVPLATSPRVTLDLFADNQQLLGTLSSTTISDYRRLPAQAYALFGGYHYRHYDFLMALSNFVANGTEHQQSSEVGAGADYYADPNRLLAHADLLTHEYVHSWNGKFMRPAGQVKPNYQDARNDSMLWVYEGLTQYLGQVLATRIGLWTKRDFREQLAYWAAHMVHRTGRSWRDLEDVTVASPLRFGTSKTWSNYTRGNGTDDYRSGVLLWLDVDTKIRQLSHDQRSLNGFCKLFFGRDGHSMETVPYTLHDLVTALNRVQPYDWASFLHSVLYRIGPNAKAPLAGITRGGWKLVYTPHESRFMKVITQHYIYGNGTGPAQLHEMDSIGLDVNGKGQIVDVLWNGPAFKAGLAPSMQIVEVNGVKFTPSGLTSAIASAAKGARPIRLVVQDKAWRQQFHIDYHGGLRYPRLVRVKGVPDYLDQILSPMTVDQLR